MKHLRFVRTPIAAALATLAAAAGGAEPASPYGGEYRINTFTAGAQTDPSIARSRSGLQVVFWKSATQDSGFSPGIWGQRYDKNSNLVGGEVHANTTTSSVQQDPSVAMDDAGNFVVAWESLGQDGDGYGIYAQRFNSSGVKQGVEFRVNTATAGAQRHPSVAVAPLGDFVIAWDGPDGADGGIWAQRYSAAGVASGVNFVVNETTANDQHLPSVGIDKDGDFVVAWSGGQPGASNDVLARQFAADGTAISHEFTISQATAFEQDFPSLAMNQGGDFVVTWTSPIDDISSSSIFARRYDRSGTAQGNEFRVNTHVTNSSHSFPSVSMDDEGDFAVVWSFDNLVTGKEEVYGRRFSHAGRALGPQFPLAVDTANNIMLPDVAMDANGDFLTAFDHFGQDSVSVSGGIYGQRFEGSPIGVVELPDVNANSASEKAVLAEGTGGERVVVRDGLTGASLTTFVVPTVWRAQAIVGLPDSGGSAAADIAVSTLR